MKACVIFSLLVGCLWGEYQIERAFGDKLSDLEGTVTHLRPFSRLVHLGCVTLSPITAWADDALLRRARAGDISALEALYRTYESAIFTLARRLCGTSEDADDVLQDTFIEVSRSLSRYRGEGTLLGWMKKICASKALMRLRRTTRFPEEALDELSGSEPFRGRIDIEAALGRLSPAARAVVWLHDVEGYTHGEIAELLQKSVSFSKSALSRGHARMRALLSDEGKDPLCGT